VQGPALARRSAQRSAAGEPGVENDPVGEQVR
jgi:hypothetical protein